MFLRVATAALAAGLTTACVAQSSGGSAARQAARNLVSSPQQARAMMVGKTVEDPRRGLLLRLESNGRGLAWRRGDASSTPVKWSLKNGAQMKKSWGGGMTGLSDSAQFVSITYPPSADMPRGRITDLQVDFLRPATDAGAPPPARP